MLLGLRIALAIFSIIWMIRHPGPPLLAGQTVAMQGGVWDSKHCASVEAPASYRWAPTDSPDQLGLLRNGVQVGAWHTVRRVYRTYDAAMDRWGAVASPPIPPPGRHGPCSAECTCGCAQGGDCGCSATKAPTAVGDVAPKDNFGLQLDRLGRRERYTVSGRDASREEARHVVESGGKQIPDDASKMRLTIIGTDAECDRVLGDFSAHQALAGLRDKLVIQDYPPSHWAVARAGFVTNGAPTIYLQAADGKVLHRQDDYRGPDLLAAAIRKADPNYDAKKDPDATKGRTDFDLARVPAAVWIAAAGILGFYLARRPHK